MNLQNLTYTINNLSQRQKIGTLVAVVGASAIISTIALSQRQSNRTTVNQVPDRPLPVTASPLAPTTTLPSPTARVDTTLAPGVVNSSGSTTTRFNSGVTTSPGNNLTPGVGNSVTNGNLPTASGNATSGNLNYASPSLNTVPSPNLTSTPQGRVFVPNVSNPNIAPASPAIPSATAPLQDFTVPSPAPVPVNPITPQDNFNATDSSGPLPSSNATDSSDSSLPSSTEPTFDSRTGTYTTTPRATNNSANGGVSSPTNSFGNNRNTFDFNSNPNFSRPSGGSNNTNINRSPIYGNSNGSSSSNPIYSNPNGSVNSNSIYGTPNGGSTSNTSPNGTTTPSN